MIGARFPVHPFHELVLFNRKTQTQYIFERLLTIILEYHNNNNK